MNKRFKEAATPKHTPQDAPKNEHFVIVYAWPEVPDNKQAKPYPVSVLKFLCDAYRADCRVIVTSSEIADDINIGLLTTSEDLSELNPDLGDLRNLEAINKNDLQKMTEAGTLKVDLAINHKSLAKSKFPYIQPDAEVNIDRYGKTFPLTINGLYIYCHVNVGTCMLDTDRPPTPKFI